MLTIFWQALRPPNLVAVPVDGQEAESSVSDVSVNVGRATPSTMSVTMSMLSVMNGLQQPLVPYGTTQLAGSLVPERR